MKTSSSLSASRLSACERWLLLLLLSVFASCVKPARQHSGLHIATVRTTPGVHWPESDTMHFQYCIRNWNAALETDRATLVFHGIKSQRQQIFRFQEETQAVQIAGPGSSSVVVTCSSGPATLVFRSDYANGTNTLQFADRTVWITEEGKRLQAGDRCVDLSEGKKVVHLEHGKATVE